MPDVSRRRRKNALYVMLDEEEQTMLDELRDHDRSCYRAVVLRALIAYAASCGLRRA